MTNEPKTCIQKNPWIIIPAILIMGSLFVYNIRSLNKEPESPKWQKSDYTKLVNQCIKKTLSIGEKYPKVTKDYCECAANKIQKALTKKQYLETFEKDPSEQLKVITPIIQDCMGEYQDTLNILINQ